MLNALLCFVLNILRLLAYGILAFVIIAGITKTIHDAWIKGDD